MKRKSLSNIVIFILITCSVTSCKDEEFYEKEFIDTLSEQYDRDNFPEDVVQGSSSSEDNSTSVDDHTGNPEAPGDEVGNENINNENYIPAPKVQTVGVVTMLIALGDLANDNLVISESSARAMAQNAVSYTSPVVNPKILVIKDSNHNGESPNDTEYIHEVLLSNYDADILYEENEELTPAKLEGYDIVWFNNPGHPMGSEESKNLLKNFSGGVILSGDDLARGRGFTTGDLTGLEYVDNGVTVTCSDGSYHIDNNSGFQYSVVLDSKFYEGVSDNDLEFVYGNDIDLTTLIGNNENYEVLAYAYGPSDACTQARPVIVRYDKN